MIRLTLNDFKKIKCSMDMQGHGDRIIGYVDKGFLDSLNELINDKSENLLNDIRDISKEDTNTYISIAINKSLKEDLKKLEAENSKLVSILELFQESSREMALYTQSSYKKIATPQPTTEKEK